MRKNYLPNVDLLGGQVTLGLLVLVILIFSLLSPSFFTLQNFTNILVQASALTIIATGMTLVLLTAGIDLSVGSVMFVTGVISGKLAVAGWPIGLVIPFTWIIGLLFGMLNGLFIIRLKIVPFIVTLATFYAGRGLGLLISETRAVNLPDTFLQIGSAKVAGVPLPVIIMIVVVAAAHTLLSNTAFGRQVYAVGNHPEKAIKAGINVNTILLSVYVICGFCAALGGVVATAQLGAVSPTFGLQSEFVAIAAAVLGGTSLFGGKGNVFPGTVIGALLIQSIQSGLVIINANPYLYPLITGAIIFLVVLADSQQHYRSKRVQKPGLV
ncbi:MAG: ABC transporter permease [Tunicatimonas sp.]